MQDPLLATIIVHSRDVTDEVAFDDIRDAANGSRWIEAILADLTEDPVVAGLLVNARDVTARKLAESERDSALVVAAVFPWEQDQGTRRIRWWCDGDALRWLGPWRRVLERCQLEGEPEFGEVEYRMRTTGGQWIWVFDRAQITARTADGRMDASWGRHLHGGWPSAQRRASAAPD